MPTPAGAAASSHGHTSHLRVYPAVIGYPSAPSQRPPRAISPVPGSTRAWGHYPGQQDDAAAAHGPAVRGRPGRPAGGRDASTRHWQPRHATPPPAVAAAQRPAQAHTAPDDPRRQPRVPLSLTTVATAPHSASPRHSDGSARRVSPRPDAADTAPLPPTAKTGTAGSRQPSPAPNASPIRSPSRADSARANSQAASPRDRHSGGASPAQQGEQPPELVPPTSERHELAPARATDRAAPRRCPALWRRSRRRRRRAHADLGLRAATAWPHSPPRRGTDLRPPQAKPHRQAPGGRLRGRHPPVPAEPRRPWHRDSRRCGGRGSPRRQPRPQCQPDGGWAGRGAPPGSGPSRPPSQAHGGLTPR